MSLFDPVCEIPPIVAEWFDGAAVRLDPNMEGQRVRDDLMFMGTYAGPSSTIDNLIHEMCHFVEMDEARFHLDGFGFYYGKWISTPFDRYRSGFHEYFGVKDLEREIRVMAWQMNVCETFGFAYDAKELNHSLVFVPGFDNLSIHYKGMPSEQRRLNWTWKQIQTQRTNPAFTPERFVAEWRRRNLLLPQRLALTSQRLAG